VMRAPGSYQRYQVAHFNVSTLGTEVRHYKDDYMVTVIEQGTGLAVPNASVTVLNHDNKQLGEVLRSDKFGQVSISKEAKPRLISIVRGADFNLISLSQHNPLDLSDFSAAGKEHKALELFIFGPRDLYRRDEDVRYYALLRDQDGKKTAQLPLPASLIDPVGNEIATSLVHAKDGLYQFDHHFANDALTGRYELRFSIGKQIYSHHFNVEDFMPQRMEITLSDDNKPMQQAGDAQQALSGLFLYGAPASEHKSDGLVRLKTTNVALANLKGYYFGQHADIGTLDSYDIPPITLDKAGHGVLAIEDRWSKLKHAVAIEGYAYLYETGGRKVSKKFSQLWWPQSSLIGIKPAFDDLTSESEQPIEFSLLRSNLASQLQDDKVLVSLIRHHQEFYWQYSKQGGWQRLERNDVYPVWQQELSLSSKQALTIKAPVEWGKYELVVSSTVDDAKASLMFEAGQRWYWRWAENNGNSVRPDQIKLALDKAAYRNGDKAMVKIDAPYAGQAWLRIESDTLLWQQQVALTKGVNSLEIPIKDWQRHDVYLSAYLIKPGSKTSPIKRALGLTHIALEREDRKLNVSLDAPDKVTPDQLVALSATVANANSDTQVILAAVDVGILNLHNFKIPEPLNHFFAKRGYGVDIIDNFNQIISPNQLAKADILWGGGAELAHGGAEASAKVQIVSYLSQPQQVDQHGIAHFKLPLPYFNGRIRLFAIAFDQQRFGTTKQPLTVAADLVSQINMPRFLAVGDRAMFKLDLTNTTDNPLDVTVNLSAKGLTLKAPSSQISLAAKQKITLPIAVSAETVSPNAQLKLNISGSNIEIKRQWSMAVRPAYPAQRRSENIVLAPNQEHQFNLTANDWSPQTQSSISIATRPQFDLTEHVKQLFEFPLGCLEQTSSRLYPWLILPPASGQRVAKQLGDINREQLIDSGIKRILSLQTYNGALSLWHSNGDASPWLSAYGAQVLLQAQENGIYVPPLKLEKLLKRLAHYLRRGNFSAYGDAPNYRFSTRAYAALVLAGLGRANQSHMRELIKNVRHSKSPYPVVQLAAAFKLMGDSKRSEQLINEAKQLSYQPHYSGNYASAIRDKAMMINMLLKHRLDTSWAQQLSFELWQELSQRQWFSTQERLALVLADNQLAAHFDQDFDYTLQVGDSTFSGPDKFSAFYRVDGAPINQTRLSNHAKHSLYVNTISQGYPLQPPAYQEAGLNIRRDYYDLTGQPVSLLQVQSGQRFITRIRLQSTAQSLKDIMVVDLLPAGFEIENGALGEQLALEKLSIDGKTLAQRQSPNDIDYQGYRDDRYIAAVSVYSHRETELFYMVQAVTPGQYQQPPVMAESMYRHDIVAVGRPGKEISVK